MTSHPGKSCVRKIYVHKITARRFIKNLLPEKCNENI